MRTAVTGTARTLLLALALAAAGLPWAFGCDGEGDDDDDVVDDDDDDTGNATLPWTITPIGDLDIGLQNAIAVADDGTVVVATFGNAAWEDGICEEIEVNPPTRMRQTLYLATSAGEDGWTTEVIDEPVTAFTPTGVDVAFDPAGRPAVAYNGGEPEQQFCGANDAVYGVLDGGTWAFETAGAESGDSATGDPASDAGFVVGLWPALAYDGEGNPAILHKDTHFGSMQHDDLYRADAELAWRTGGWVHEAPDYGEGAGDYGELLFDGDGRPVALYAITVEDQTESRHGVWAARRAEDGTWERVKLHTGAIYQEIAGGIDPATGDIVVAFYSAADLAVRVRRLSDPDAFTDAASWSDELVGKAQYDEGQGVSMTFLPGGELALAYHRCRLVTSGSSGCDPNDEAVVFARWDGATWRYETVVEADAGSCGEYTAVGVDDEGLVTIAYRCTIQVDGDFEFRLFAATKDF